MASRTSVWKRALLQLTHSLGLMTMESPAMSAVMMGLSRFWKG
jgi:hypothetical protein